MKSNTIAFNGDLSLRQELIRTAKKISLSEQRKDEFLFWLSDNTDDPAIALSEASSNFGISEEVFRVCSFVYSILEVDFNNILDQLIASCEPGVDTSSCWDELAPWILRDSEQNLLKYSNRIETQKCIINVANLYADKCANKDTWRLTEGLCRTEAMNLTIFCDDKLDDGEAVAIRTINPEFCAVWGAARVAALRGREVYSSWWVSSTLGAWLKAAEQSFKVNRHSQNLPYAGISRRFAASVAQDMTRELFNKLLDILKNASMQG